MGDLFFYLPIKRCRSYREAVLHNLSLIFSGANSDTSVCARGVFQNFASYMREFLWLGKITTRDFFKEVTLVGVENLDAVSKMGKGAFLVSAHFGNWEWGGIGLALCGYDIHFFVRPHKNTYTNKLFLRLRKKHRVKVITFPFLRQAIKVLQGKGLVATLVDEAEAGVTVEMFQKKLTLASGPFEMAYRYKSAISPVFMVRDRNSGKQREIIEPPILLDYTLDVKASVEIAAQKFARIMEDYLKFYPDHWLLLTKKNFN